MCLVENRDDFLCSHLPPENVKLYSEKNVTFNLVSSPFEMQFIGNEIQTDIIWFLVSLDSSIQ